MFQKNDIVVYNNSGVYRIMEIGPVSFSSDKKKQYYTLESVFFGNSSVVYTPVDGKSYIRKVMEEKEVHTCIEKIPAIQTREFQSVKNQILLEQQKELLNTHDTMRYLCALKEIAVKKAAAEQKKKRLGEIELQFQQKLLNIIGQEFAYALHTTVDEAKHQLEKNLADMVTAA